MSTFRLRGGALSFSAFLAIGLILGVTALPFANARIEAVQMEAVADNGIVGGGIATLARPQVAQLQNIAMPLVAAPLPIRTAALQVATLPQVAAQKVVKQAPPPAMNAIEAMDKVSNQLEAIMANDDYPPAVKMAIAKANAAIEENKKVMENSAPKEAPVVAPKAAAPKAAAPKAVAPKPAAPKAAAPKPAAPKPAPKAAAPTAFTMKLPDSKSEVDEIMSPVGHVSEKGTFVAGTSKDMTPKAPGTGNTMAPDGTMTLKDKDGKDTLVNVGDFVAEAIHEDDKVVFMDLPTDNDDAASPSSSNAKPKTTAAAPVAADTPVQIEARTKLNGILKLSREVVLVSCPDNHKLECTFDAMHCSTVEKFTADQWFPLKEEKKTRTTPLDLDAATPSCPFDDGLLVVETERTDQPTLFNFKIYIGTRNEETDAMVYNVVGSCKTDLGGKCSTPKVAKKGVDDRALGCKFEMSYVIQPSLDAASNIV